MTLDETIWAPATEEAEQIAALFLLFFWSAFGASFFWATGEVSLFAMGAIVGIVAMTCYHIGEITSRRILISRVLTTFKSEALGVCPYCGYPLAHHCTVGGEGGGCRLVG